MDGIRPVFNLMCLVCFLGMCCVGGGRRLFSWDLCNLSVSVLPSHLAYLRRSLCVYPSSSLLSRHVLAHLTIRVVYVQIH